MTDPSSAAGVSMQTIQILFDVLVALVSGLGGWILATMWKEIKDARKDHSDLIGKLPETYARRDDVADAISRIERAMTDGLNRIFDKLDGKADKPHR